jgi:hypothetical protein
MPRWWKGDVAISFSHDVPTSVVRFDHVSISRAISDSSVCLPLSRALSLFSLSRRDAPQKRKKLAEMEK